MKNAEYIECINNNIEYINNIDNVEELYCANNNISTISSHFNNIKIL